MAKFTPKLIQNLDNPPTVVSQINYNFETLQLLIDTLLSRDGATPNTMQSNLDMNNYRVLNLPVPVSPQEPARHGDIQQYVDRAEDAAEASEQSAAESAESAAEAAEDLEEFQSEYLGAFPSDPVIDKNGNPPKDGAFYYNTSDGTVRVHSILRVVIGTDNVNVSGNPVYVNKWIILPVPLFTLLEDVDLSSAVAGDFLRWSGNSVVPVTLSAEHVLQDNGFFVGDTVQDALDDILTRTSLGIYDIAFFASGLMENNETLFRMVASRPFGIQVNAPESVAISRVAANATTDISLQKNGVQFGTITFAAASTNGVFSVAGTTLFEPGDILSLVGPATADTALRDLSVTLACWR
jgi:hypothetical protein